MPRIDDVAARQLILAAWQQVMPQRPITRCALQCVQAMCRLESFYGQAWHGAMTTSNNWGAIQCNARPVDGKCPPGCAAQHDSSPTPSGQHEYLGCFKVYATPLEGCADVLRWLSHRPDVLDMADTGDAKAFSSALHAAHYFEGFGSTVEVRIQNHCNAVLTNAALAAAAIREECLLRDGEVCLTPPCPPATEE